MALKTINATFGLDESQIGIFERALRDSTNVIDFKVLPDTNALYEKDDAFKKLIKAKKDAQRVLDVYINKHNFE